MLHCIVYCLISLLQRLLEDYIHHWNTANYAKHHIASNKRLKPWKHVLKRKLALTNFNLANAKPILVLADTSALRLHNVKLLDIDVTSALQDAQVA